MHRNERRIIPIVIAMTVILAAAGALYARAGGGGGGGGGGDDGIGLIIELVLMLLFELPFPWNIITTGALIAAFVVFSLFTKKKVRERTVYNSLPKGTEENKTDPRTAREFLKLNPGFDEAGFLATVKDAFVKIQEAWQAQDISPVRRFISDGVYQRFNTQFTMMKILKQKNVLSDIMVNNVYIDRVESDGLYDIVHAAIHASMNDRFTSELDHSLDSGGAESFVEYWSFMKKRGAPRVDIYATDACPKCGTPLPKNMGDTSRCGSCGTLTNTGEYDWVLSEITQSDDYIGRHPKLRKSDDLNEKVRALVEENADFAVQLVEDRASNGYLQMLTSVAVGDPSIMRRFVSDAVFEKMKARTAEGAAAYNRLYLNDAYLVGAWTGDGRNNLAVAIRSSYQRVALKSGRAVMLDPAVTSRTEVVVLSRDRGTSASKGSIYARECPACGAPVADSLEVKCPYCGIDYNSTANDWVITNLLTTAEYKSHFGQIAAGPSFGKDPDLIDRLYDARDFALNNVMVIAGSDGAISPDERKFLESLASRWGYNHGKIEPLFGLALNGRLALRMPEDAKKRAKIYRLMEKAARLDDTITERERAVLEDVRKRFVSNAA